MKCKIQVYQGGRFIVNINERVKMVRTELNLTQSEFGAKIVVAQNYLSNIEKGYRDVTEKIIKIICSEFNVNEHWLRTGEGEIFIEQTIDEEFADIIAEAMLEDNDEIKDLIIRVGKMSGSEFKLVSDFVKLILESREK